MATPEEEILERARRNRERTSRAGVRRVGAVDEAGNLRPTGSVGRAEPAERIDLRNTQAATRATTRRTNEALRAEARQRKIDENQRKQVEAENRRRRESVRRGETQVRFDPATGQTTRVNRGTAAAAIDLRNQTLDDLVRRKVITQAQAVDLAKNPQSLDRAIAAGTNIREQIGDLATEARSKARDAEVGLRRLVGRGREAVGRARDFFTSGNAPERIGEGIRRGAEAVGRTATAAGVTPEAVGRAAEATAEQVGRTARAAGEGVATPRGEPSIETPEQADARVRESRDVPDAPGQQRQQGRRGLLARGAERARDFFGRFGGDSTRPSLRTRAGRGLGGAAGAALGGAAIAQELDALRPTSREGEFQPTLDPIDTIKEVGGNIIGGTVDAIQDVNPFNVIPLVVGGPDAELTEGSAERLGVRAEDNPLQRLGSIFGTVGEQSARGLLDLGTTAAENIGRLVEGDGDARPVTRTDLPGSQQGTLNQTRIAVNEGRAGGIDPRTLPEGTGVIRTPGNEARTIDAREALAEARAAPERPELRRVINSVDRGTDRSEAFQSDPRLVNQIRDLGRSDPRLGLAALSGVVGSEIDQRQQEQAANAPDLTPADRIALARERRLTAESVLDRQDALRKSASEEDQRNFERASSDDPRVRALGRKELFANAFDAQGEPKTMAMLDFLREAESQGNDNVLDKLRNFSRRLTGNVGEFTPQAFRESFFVKDGELNFRSGGQDRFVADVSDFPAEHRRFMLEFFGEESERRRGLRR